MTRALPHLADQLFFLNQPHRLYRARPFHPADSPLPPWVTLFADDGRGNIVEVNLVIVKRIVSGRARLLFATRSYKSLESDDVIVVFLLGRGIDPVTLKKGTIR